MEEPVLDPDLALTCAVCGVSPDEEHTNYVYDPVTMEVIAYCATHYHERLVALYGEDTVQAIEEWACPNVTA